MDESGFHFKGRYLGIRETDGWEFATRTNASAVVILVPVTDDDELVLVEQYRVPVQCSVIELPAGLVGDQDDPDESLMTAARRELPCVRQQVRADLLDAPPVGAARARAAATTVNPSPCTRYPWTRRPNGLRTKCRPENWSIRKPTERCIGWIAAGPAWPPCRKAECPFITGTRDSAGWPARSSAK